MNLLLVSGRLPPRPDGIGDYTAHLARALRGRGWRIQAMCAGDATKSGTCDFPVTCVARWSLPGLARIVAEARRLTPAALLWQYNPFSYGRKGLCPEYALLPWLLRRAAGVPTVVTLHELAFPWGRGGVRGLVWAITQRLQLALIARSSAALVVTTGQRAAWLHRRWPASTVARIPVGSVLPTTVLGTDECAAVRAQLGWPKDAFLLGAFGTLNAGRPLSGAIRALAQLPDARLVWVGDLGGCADRLAHWQALASTHGVLERLRWTGRLAPDHAARVLAACDALLAIYDDGISGRRTTVAAALQQGVPVLGIVGPATDADRFTPGTAYEPVADDAGSIAAAVCRLREDRALADRLATGARAAYQRWFTWERIAADYDDVLRQLGLSPQDDGAPELRERGLALAGTRER